jgi:hypothetical protein
VNREKRNKRIMGRWHFRGIYYVQDTGAGVLTSMK